MATVNTTTVNVGDTLRCNADGWGGVVTSIDDTANPATVTLRMNIGEDRTLAVTQVHWDPLQQARQQLDTMNTDVPGWKSQIAADISAVQAGGWDSLTAAQRTQIMLRILNGFTSVLDAVMSHATVTGVIPPS